MSLTIASAVIFLLTFLSKATGLELPFTEADIEEVVTTIIGVISFLGVIWGRVRAGGVNWIGLRTK